uniref:Uncharacterized protein n=1 Tax=Oryzias melastigma TaxID=30732 RepID=A0A3B3BP11_ORYME
MSRSQVTALAAERAEIGQDVTTPARRRRADGAAEKRRGTPPGEEEALHHLEVLQQHVSLRLLRQAAHRVRDAQLDGALHRGRGGLHRRGGGSEEERLNQTEPLIHGGELQLQKIDGRRHAAVIVNNYYGRIRPPGRDSTSSFCSDPPDLDSAVSSGGLDQILAPPSDQKPAQPRTRSFFQSVVVSRVVRPDGTVEERRTVRDGHGHEETTVTRSGGPRREEEPEQTAPVLPGESPPISVLQQRLQTSLLFLLQVELTESAQNSGSS